MSLQRDELFDDESGIGALGAQSDAVAGADTGTFSIVALLKRIAQRATSILSSIGSPADTVATTDTGSFSLVALTKRLLQKTSTGVFMTGPQAGVSNSFNSGPTTLVAKAAPGSLLGFNLVNYASGTRYLQFFDRTTAPTPGLAATRQFPISLGAASAPTVFAYGNDYFGVAGLTFATGIVWAISLTSGTYTPASAGDCDVQVLFV